MNGSFDLSLHWWRGIGPDREPDLFLIRWRLGFVTVSVCRSCMLKRYRKFRLVIEEAIERSEGR